MNKKRLHPSRLLVVAGGWWPQSRLTSCDRSTTNTYGDYTTTLEGPAHRSNRVYFRLNNCPIDNGVLHSSGHSGESPSFFMVYYYYSTTASFTDIAFIYKGHFAIHFGSLQASQECYRREVGLGLGVLCPQDTSTITRWSLAKIERAPFLLTIMNVCVYSVVHRKEWWGFMPTHL